MVTLLRCSVLRPLSRLADVKLLQTQHPLPRLLSTLPGHPHIYTFPTSIPNSHLLTLLPTNPPTPALSLGTTTSIPPTPASFTENPNFLHILQSVLATHASSDPTLLQQAATLPSSSGISMFASTNRNRRSTHTYPHNPTKYGGSSTGGGNLQGPGAGSGRTGGGWIHLSDLRAPPDWGRIADTEDIFGSVEVEILEGGGAKIREGSYQSCIGYRLVTRNGIMRLSPYLSEKMIERLRDKEKEIELGSSKFTTV